MAGFWLPVLQALGTGAVLALLLAGLAFAAGGDPLTWLIVGGVGGLAAGWFIGLAWWRGQLEAQRQTDIARNAETINVHATLDPGDGFLWGEFLDGLSISRAHFEKLAGELVRDPEFTGARFGGRGKLLSRDQFQALRGRLIKAGFVRWKSRGRTPGCELTYAGEAIFKRIAGSRNAQTYKRTNESGLNARSN